MASETWTKEHCPKCNSGNWVNCGDVNDCTALDVDAICCYNCHHVYWIEGYTEVYYGEIEDLVEEGVTKEEAVNKILHETANIEVGRKNPDDPYIHYYSILELQQAKDKENEERQQS